MSRYALDDGIFVDTENAQLSFQENTQWNGHNHISRATGSQWEHETLHLSSKGRWYIEHTSQYQGSLPSAVEVTAEAAATWLLSNDYELSEIPESLQSYALSTCE